MKKQTTPQSESQIQHSCLTWFRLQYPSLSLLMFAVPNGGKRDAKTGARMKYEGSIRGVADLILLIPKKGFASLCIEMKTPHVKGKRAGTQSDEQKEWQALVEKYGSVYVVCHGLIEFINSVCYYLKADPQPYINNVLRNYYKLI